MSARRPRYAPRRPPLARIDSNAGDEPACKEGWTGLFFTLLKALLPLLPVVAFIAFVRASGWLDGLTGEGVRTTVHDLGWLGPLFFFLIYALGILGQVPGSLFVGAAVLAYGPFGGLALSYVGALIVNLVGFGLVRVGRALRPGQAARRTSPAFGESPPHAPAESAPHALAEGAPRAFRESAPLALTESAPRALGDGSPRGMGRLVLRLRSTALWARLEARPYVAVSLIKMVFPTTAMVTFALALTQIPWEAYVVGSLLGTLPQLLVTVGLFAWAFGEAG